MIYNGIDYTEIQAILFAPSAPSDYYVYRQIGVAGANIWNVADYSDNVVSATIDKTATHGTSWPWYVFIHLSYSNQARQGSIQEDWVEIANNNPSFPHSTYTWQVVLGTLNISSQPIWEDLELSGPSDISRFQYNIRQNGIILYNGYSYLKPEQSINKFKVNDVVRDYLGTSFPSLGSSWVKDNDAEKSFDVYIGMTENETPNNLLATIDFIYDWSYIDFSQYPSEAWLAMEPIQNYYDSRQYHIFSVNGKATLTDTHSISYINSNNARSILCTQLNPGTYYLYSDGGTYSKTFTVQDNCGIRYCLYYVNSRGGWDSLLVDGNYLQTSRYTRDTFTQNYLTPSINRGTIEYRNNIHETWTLYLKGLSDSQNKLYHNLYESTNVYLHDLEEGRIVPVVITSSEMQYKTRKNQGRKLYSYEIQVESSQNKLRM